MIYDNNEYLQAIGITEPYLQKIKPIEKFYREIVGFQEPQLFVSDYFTQEGRREYESLWLFSGNTLAEAKSFYIGDIYDSVKYGGNISYWELRKESYDFVDAKNESRLYIKLSLTHANVQAELKASGNNCSYLSKIFRELIVPKLVL